MLADPYQISTQGGEYGSVGLIGDPLPYCVWGGEGGGGGGWGTLLNGKGRQLPDLSRPSAPQPGKHVCFSRYRPLPNYFAGKGSASWNTGEC